MFYTLKLRRSVLNKFFGGRETEIEHSVEINEGFSLEPLRNAC